MEPISLKNIKRYSIRERKSKVKVEEFGSAWNGGTLLDWLYSLPDILCARDLKQIVKKVSDAVQSRKMVLLGMGAHPIKIGLSPVIIDLMKKRIIRGIAMNGACIIHDLEIAMAGNTSEDVEEELRCGRFGMTEETAVLLNRAISEGYKKRIGLGCAVGKMISESDFPYKKYSILANAYELKIPATVHVAIGTDIIHMHPEADPAAIGWTSHLDFRIFAKLVSELEGGVFINMGSAVIIPEVFLKALSLVRNLGYNVYEFTAINLDFIKQYRATVNVVERPTKEKGKGYYIIGHNEIMFPLIAALIQEELKRRLKD